jgi:transposase
MRATMERGAGANNMKTMPRKKRKPAMTPKAFRDLLGAAGLDPQSAAPLLGVGKSTVYRWLSGDTNIAASSALLIQSRIKPKKK